MWNIIFGQVFGIAATALTFLSYQANTKKWLLIIQSLGTLCTAISYLFLGATSGLILNIVCILRNIAFFFQKEGSPFHFISACGFAVAMIVLGALFWQGWFSLLLIIALAANTFFLSFGKPQLLRKSILCTSTMVLIYNAFVFSLGGIVNEALAVISSFVGIIRYAKEQQKSEIQK